jgi:hypothetical protein
LGIDIESLQNRLLKVCYVPATSASLSRLLFFTVAINSTNEANKAGGTCLQAVYNYLDVYDFGVRFCLQTVEKPRTENS